jgi:hypothetical protein
VITLVFSAPRSWVSRVIRWLINSPVSHVAVLYLDETMDLHVILEANTCGYSLTAWEVWIRRNQVVRTINVEADLNAGLRTVVRCMGQENAFWRRFGRKACSEVAVKILQAGGCPRVRTAIPESTSPADLLQLLS